MTTWVADRTHYEEAVATGVVFSPSVLLSIPFTNTDAHRVAMGIAAALLLAVTAAGALWFRSGASNRTSLLLWKLNLCWLLAAVLLASSTAAALRVGGHWVTLGVAATISGLLGWAFLTGRLARQASQTEANPRIVGLASAAGAGLGAPLMLLAGHSFIAALVIGLQLILAVISAMIALLTASELHTRPEHDA
jgi:hypothetical protein